MPNDTGQYVTLNAVILLSTLFLEHALWFDLLQDEGKEVTLDKIESPFIYNISTSANRSTAPGGYEEFYLNVKTLTAHVPNFPRISFKDTIRSV